MIPVAADIGEMPSEKSEAGGGGGGSVLVLATGSAIVARLLL